jgi:hypothetical protein
MDAKRALTTAELTDLISSAKVDASDYEKVIAFLLYYGVLGIQVGEVEYFIFDVNYDIKVLQVRAERGKDATRYIVNTAFWPAFSIAA